MPEEKPLPNAEPNEPDDERTTELVAYLDGELDPKAAEVMATKLSFDPKLRNEADELKRTWDLLDHLPRAEPSQDFTSKTVSRILPVPTGSSSQSAVRASGGQKTPPTPRWKKVAFASIWLLLVFGVGWLGFWGRQLAFPEPKIDLEAQIDAEIAKDKRLLQNLRHYRPIRELDYLKSLDHPHLFGEEAP